MTCGYVMDANSSVGDKLYIPKENDISFCMNCGTLYVRHYKKWASMTEKEYIELPDDLKKKLNRYEELRKKVVDKDLAFKKFAVKMEEYGMIPERYMFRGRRVKDGEWVEGFLMMPVSRAHIEYCIQRIKPDEYGIRAFTEIDLATVEPVAVPPKNINGIKEPVFMVGICPNCECYVEDDEIFGGEWCRHCGQRLDWGENTKEE